jgi:hypothetical protein
VGSYDPKLGQKQSGGIIDKTERFKAPKGKAMQEKQLLGVVMFLKIRTLGAKYFSL